MRRLLIVVGLVVAAFSVGCLNFTSFAGVEHHREWAREHGMPEPSTQIFLLGVTGAVFGAGLAGYALGRSRKTQ